MILDSIQHAAIFSSSYSAAKDFYVNKLGFQVIREDLRGGKNDWIMYLKSGNIELEIFVKPHLPKKPEERTVGLDHLCFRVDSVQQTVNELAEVGIECQPIKTDELVGGRMTFFYDPDGLKFELHE